MEGKERASKKEANSVCLPKRPKPAYLFFYEDECKEIKKNSGDEKISNEVKRNIGEKWKNLPDNMKVGYKKKAKESSDEYATKKAKLPTKPAKETINTRCSPERVHKMLQNLKQFQKELVNDIGFGSLLHLKCIKLQRDLCLDLVERFNPETKTLELDGVSIHFSHVDVKDIMGLKAGGIDVPTTGSKGDIDKMCQNYGFEKGDIPLETLETQLTNTNLSGDEFKVKFVLFVLGALLCPTKKLVSKCTFLYALNDAKQINNMNWAKFVFDFLVEGVRKYKAKQQKSIDGCLLVLMIFYLEQKQDAPFSSRNGHHLEAWGNEEVKQILNKLEWDKICNRKEKFVANDSSNGVLQVRREEHCDQHPFSEPRMEENSESKKFEERCLSVVEKAIDIVNNLVTSKKDIMGKKFSEREKGKGKGKVSSEWEKKKEMEANSSTFDPDSISSTPDPESNLHKAKEEKEASCRTQSKNLMIISPFTECQSKFILAYIFDPKLDKSETLADYDGEFANRNAFFSLQAEEWIRSEIINIVVWKLTSEQIRNVKIQDCFLPTYFSQKLLSENAPQNDAERSDFWIKFRNYIKHLWVCNKIYIPMNDNNQHWYLCVINLNSRIIEIWDSLPCPQRNKEREIQVENMLVNFCNYYIEKISHNRWELNLRQIFFSNLATEEENFRPLFSNFCIKTPLGVSKQENTWDCGLYVIHFMRVGNYAEFKDDSSISRYREYFALELVLDRDNLKRHTIAKNAIKYGRIGSESKLHKAEDEKKKASCSTQLIHKTILLQFNAKFSTTMVNFICNDALDESEILADYLYYSANREDFINLIDAQSTSIDFNMINMVVCKLNAEQRTNNSEMIEWFLPTDFMRYILRNKAPQNDVVDISDFQNLFNHYIPDLRRCGKIYIPINKYEGKCKCEDEYEYNHYDTCERQWYLCVINLGLGITQIWESLPFRENDEERDNQVTKVVNFFDYFFEKIKRRGEDNDHRLGRVSFFPIEIPHDVQNKLKDPKYWDHCTRSYDGSFEIVYFMQEGNCVKFEADTSHYLMLLALELVLDEENTERDTIVKKAFEYKANGRFIT